MMNRLPLEIAVFAVPHVDAAAMWYVLLLAAVRLLRRPRSLLPAERGQPRCRIRLPRRDRKNPTQIRTAWPEVKIILRGDSGFCRNELMKLVRENNVDFLFGMAKNKRRPCRNSITTFLNFVKIAPPVPSVDPEEQNPPPIYHS